VAAPDDPRGAAPDDEPWPEEQPDAFAEADRRWEAKWTDEPKADEEPVAELAGPLPPAPNVAAAYNTGMREAGPHLGLGLQIAGAMALFTGGGYFADRALGTSPWGVVLGAALALVAVVALVVRLAKEADAASKRKRAARGPGARRGGV
jgi:F0F1-type ATP synthase assembly protein I